MEENKEDYLVNRPGRYAGYDICLICQNWDGIYPGSGKCNISDQTHLYNHECSQAFFSGDHTCFKYITKKQIEATHKKRTIKRSKENKLPIKDKVCLCCKNWVYLNEFSGKCIQAEDNLVTKYYYSCSINKGFDGFEPNEYGKYIASIASNGFDSLYAQILEAADTYASR